MSHDSGHEPQHLSAWSDGSDQVLEANRSRRRFLLGGVGALAGVALGPMLSDVAAAHDPGAGDGAAATQDGAEVTQGGETGGHGTADIEEAEAGAEAEQVEAAPPRLPVYRNRVMWGAEETLRFDGAGAVSYPMAFFPVQKVIIHHTASWVSGDLEGVDAADLVQQAYREHVARDFGDIGYHLLIAPDGSVYEGRYSGGVSFPLYDNYPGNDPGGPRLVNAAHTYNHNAGNVGIAVMGDFEIQDLNPAAWSSLVTTVALICANTGLDPHGESLYLNPINRLERVMPNICAHRSLAGTYCPGAAIWDRFDELRFSVTSLVERLDTSTWLESP